MLSRYSHVRMEAKRRALDEIAARQDAAWRTTFAHMGAPGATVTPDGRTTLGACLRNADFGR